jgi:hypothetical protein
MTSKGTFSILMMLFLPATDESWMKLMLAGSFGQAFTSSDLM